MSSFYYVMVYFCIWTIYYFSLKFCYKEKSLQWVSRFVALTHAFSICRIIEINMFFVGPWLFDTLGMKNTFSQTVIVHLSCSYFIFDTVWCLCYARNDILMLLHHFISLLGMSASLYIDKSAAEVLLTTWGSELTNPYLQIRWYLRENGLSKTRFAFCNDILFAVSFFVIRICIGGILTNYSYNSKMTTDLVKLGGYAFYFINILWMLQISKFAYRKLCR